MPHSMLGLLVKAFPRQKHRECKQSAVCLFTLNRESFYFCKGMASEKSLSTPDVTSHTPVGISSVWELPAILY